MARSMTLTLLLSFAALVAVGRPDGRDAPAPLSALPAAAASAAQKAAPAAASFRFPPESEGGAAPAPSAPPLSLTASDGTGLTLVALEADAVLEPPLAFTELRLTFENPRDSVLEGRFRIALPPGAAISRFAMEIGGAWQEGEVVERQRARVAYEDFLHRRQDPALLEHEAGNEFSARVFPIPARGRKRLVVSWSHALPRADQPWSLPLAGLPEIGRFDARVLVADVAAGDAAGSNLGGTVRERRLVEVHRRAWTPDRDLVVAQPPLAARRGLRQGELLILRVAPEVDRRPQEIAGLFVLVDSSASRALGYDAQLERLGGLAAGLAAGAGAATPLAVAAFDQEVDLVFEGAAGDFGEAELARLRERRALGASDLHGALGWLGSRLPGRDGRYPRVLVVTDGVATAGETAGAELRAAVAALGAAGVERLDALAVGGLRDEAALAHLTAGNLRHDGQAIDGGAPLAEIGRRLTLACRSGVAVAIEGADWVWPERLDGLQPGDEALVFAELPAQLAPRLRLDGREVPLPGEIAVAERPLLERALVQARIERLLHRRETSLAGDPDLRRAIALEVAELSVEHRVLSPFTALLVLETEADYERFGLDRRALADVLTVGAGGIEVADRRLPREIPWTPGKDAPPPPTVAAAEMPQDEGLVEGEAGAEAAAPGGAVGDIIEVTARAPAVQASSITAGPPLPDPAPSAPGPLHVAGEADALAVSEEIVVEQAPRRVRTGEGRALARLEPAAGPAPHSGRFAEVLGHLAAGRGGRALALAEAWSVEAPGDVLALLALGEAREAAGDTAGAARAYGSLIDLFPARADLRRLAGQRLERLGESALPLAVDTFRRAAELRPDHPSGHRLLAWALLRAGRPAAAFAALETGLAQRYPEGRFAGVDRVLREDLGLIAAAWLRAEPERREEVLDRLAGRDARLDEEPSLRFVLTWETDANDVDLHVFDRLGGHASYREPELASGGRLYADVTTGYGPECFTIAGAPRRGGPWRLQAHYYSRGPMGYGMGTLHVIEHDGEGGLVVEPRPFVVMADRATVDLGSAGPAGRPEKGR